MNAGRDMFQQGRRPLLRWVKGNGLDDVVTRSALAQATRLFGDRVDYCLTVNHISLDRARAVLAWATQPVELWVQRPQDNLELTYALLQANCHPDLFGYWWKYFPERVRSQAPEWLLDGDLVIVREPTWFEDWARGSDGPRLTQNPGEWAYGCYRDLVDDRDFYSALISLPPGYRYLPRMLDLLRQRPLPFNHDGRHDVDEQGCLVAAFAGLPAEPIPLHELPLAGSWVTEPLYGSRGCCGPPWGYHFARTFTGKNHLFTRLAAAGEIFYSAEVPTLVERFSWLRNHGQWGWAGWSMQPECARRVSEIAQRHRDNPVLEIGTSRGYVTAILASCGCQVTTVDQEDRGARDNLQGLAVTVVVQPAEDYLRGCDRSFPLIVVDLHGNDCATWERFWPLLIQHLLPTGTLVLYNSHLDELPEFRDQTGLRWVMETQLAGWHVEVMARPLPGMIVASRSQP